MKKTFIIALLVVLVSVSLTSCRNTISGLGRDMKNTGERITDSMKED